MDGGGDALNFLTRSGKFFIRHREVLQMGLIALVVAATADIMAGLVLSTWDEYLLLIPGLMILIYSAIGMRGNIFGAVGSRLGTAMHMGTFEMTFRKGSVLRANLESSIAISLVISVAMGVVTWIVALFMYPGKEVILWNYIFISSFAGIVACFILIGINVIIVHQGYKRDWDVDNITAPLIAAAGDIVTMPLIVLGVFLLIDAMKGMKNLVMIFSIIFMILSVVAVILIVMRKKGKRRRDEAKRIVIQSTPVLFGLIFLEIVAGTLIDTQTNTLMMYPVLLLLLPAFLNEGNALSGMLSARLCTMLHLGTLKSELIPRKGALENFLVIYIVGMITLFVIGFISWLLVAIGIVSVESGIMSDLPTVMLIMGIAGVLTITIVNIVSYFVSIATMKFDLDPDDHTMPITSTVTDVFGTIMLIFAIFLVLGMF